MLDEFSEELHNNSKLKELVELKEKLIENEEILDLIEKYKVTNDLSYKKLLLENKDYKRYKELENDLYIFTLQLNQKLKAFTKGNDEYACHKW